MVTCRGLSKSADGTSSEPHTIPFLMTLGETFDIGSDTRTSVDDGDYQVPFAFTGKVENVSVQLN